MRPNTKFGILTFIAFSFRDIFLPFILVYLVSEPYIQFGACFFFNIICLGLLLATRPLDLIWDNILEIFNNFIVLIILILYLVLFILEEKLSESQMNTFFSIPIIVNLLIIVMVNIGYSAIAGVVEVYRKIKSLDVNKGGNKKTFNFSSQDKQDHEKDEIIEKGSKKNTYVSLSSKRQKSKKHRFKNKIRFKQRRSMMKGRKGNKIQKLS